MSSSPACGWCSFSRGVGGDLMAWHLARCLTTLRKELDVQFPDRQKTMDGTIGDAAHAKRGRSSDHNPDSRGRVHAIDIDDDRGRLDWLAEHFRAMGKAGDPRVKYVISDGRIASSTAGWAWRKYKGPNAHLKHTHLSVTTAGADSGASWGLLPTGARPVLRRGDSGWFVRELQKSIGVQVDGRFGEDTDQALHVWQRARGLVSDGVCGPATWARIDQEASGARSLEKPRQEAPGVAMFWYQGAVYLTVGALRTAWGLHPDVVDKYREAGVLLLPDTHLSAHLMALPMLPEPSAS